MIIKLLDIYGHEYEIPDLKSFIGHIKNIIQLMETQIIAFTKKMDITLG